MSVAMKTLYELRFDPTDQEQWFLGQPRDESGHELDARVFTYGQPVDVPGGLTVPVENPGHPIEFNFAAFDMLVVSERVGELIEGRSPADVQRIPVRVEGRTEPYEILNVLTTIDCIDRQRTVGQLWPEESDRAGQYEMIVKLVLDPVRVPERTHIFRVGGWDVVVAVTEDVMEGLLDVTGVTFKRVSGAGLGDPFGEPWP